MVRTSQSHMLKKKFFAFSKDTQVFLSNVFFVLYDRVPFKWKTKSHLIAHFLSASSLRRQSLDIFNWPAGPYELCQAKSGHANKWHVQAKQPERHCWLTLLHPETSMDILSCLKGVYKRFVMAEVEPPNGLFKFSLVLESRAHIFRSCIRGETRSKDTGWEARHVIFFFWPLH